MKLTWHSKKVKTPSKWDGEIWKVVGKINSTKCKMQQYLLGGILWTVRSKHLSLLELGNFDRFEEFIDVSVELEKTWQGGWEFGVEVTQSTKDMLRPSVSNRVQRLRATRSVCLLLLLLWGLRNTSWRVCLCVPTRTVSQLFVAPIRKLHCVGYDQSSGTHLRLTGRSEAERLEAVEVEAVVADLPALLIRSSNIDRSFSGN